MAKRNVNARPANKSADKSADKAATKTAKTTGTKKIFLHWALGLSPYYAHSHQSREGRLITVAALIVANMAKMNKTGLGKATGGKGNAKLFKTMVGATPYNFHRREGRFNDADQLTAVGVTWFGGRIRGQDDIDLVNAVVNAFQKGGAVDGLAVEFKREIEVTA